MMDIKYGRKRSGIKKQLVAKIDDWINTIDDEDVKALVKKNTIVTGGSIASMLLGESVNDYDVYFRDLKTTKAVAEYYVGKFNEKQNNDESEYTPYVKEDKVENIKGEVEDRVLIYIKSSGVATSDDQEEHYEPQDGEYVAIESETDKEKYTPVFLSANAITLSDKLQIVIRFFGSPDRIHTNYDFSHAMNYYDYGSNNLVLKPEALECLLSRTLIYRGSLYPLCSCIRLRKFINRGWRVSAGQMLKIMWQISELDLTNHDVITEQLQGVDALYFHQLARALKDADPEKINSSYVATIIDNIFDE